MNDFLQKQTVLIVDDAPGNIKTLAFILQPDYNLAIAINGKEALKIAAIRNPDLILLDIMMPNMDGYEVCARLKSDSKMRDIPIIFITAMDDEQDEAKGLELGAVDYITKPFSHGIVKARIKRHLEREMLARELGIAHKYVQNMLDSSMHMIVSLDSQQKIIKFNKTAEKIFGYLETEVRGQDVGLLYYDPIEKNKIRDVLHESGQFIGEISSRHRDGRRFPSHLSATLLCDENNDIIGTLNNFRDISEEVALRQAREIVEQAKSAFIANMSHELRSPVNSIISVTSWLQTSELTEEQQTFLESARQSAIMLLSLLNDVLDFSKAAASQLVLKHSMFNLRDSLENVCITLAIPAFKQGVEFICAISEDIPENLLGDSIWLQRVVVNLINNAIKFTQQGEIVFKVWIEPEAELQENQVCLHFCVSDTGIGIPAEKQNEIFERFVQVDASTTRKFGGTGLGLAIAKELVTLMEGRIWVESIPDKGSAFHFIARFGYDSTASADAVAAQFVEKLDGVHILVADGHALNRQIVRKVLTACGAIVDEADTGTALLLELNEARRFGISYQVVLVDSRLPALSGAALAKTLHVDLERSTTLIIMQYPKTELNRKSTEEEDFTTLFKPILRSVLIQKIKMALGKTEQADDLKSRIEKLDQNDEPLASKIDSLAVVDKLSHTVDPCCPDPTSPAYMETMQQAMQDRDATSLEKYAQSLKMHAVAIKENHLKSVAFKMVLAVRSRDWDQTEHAFGVIIAALEQIKTEQIKTAANHT